MFLRLFDDLRHWARLARWSHDRAWGRRGEDLAHRYLRKLGYIVVARNYRTRSGSGEVDLIAWDGDALVFVEVKLRKSADFGPPDRAVDQEKKQKLILAARDYVRRAGLDWNRTRFDLVNVIGECRPEITVIRDAFSKTLTANSCLKLG
ncbi:MAG: YraN family protein [Bryobacteraceae bacterium]|nr:YraN family protein [Bryobacteraceae bacterium]MDW8379110.1 YraN family protein [Bryobacterales bacterium]